MPPATPPLLRDLNERTVLETIRDRAPISRAEISRRVGISKPTVSVALAALLEAGDLPAGALDGAVAGVPGVIEEPTGEVGLAGNIPGLEGLRIGPALQERLGVPVTVENDISLAPVGGAWRGIAQGVDDFAFLSVGTGLGCGLVLRGELHRGHHGAAGEVDYALGGDLERENDPASVGVSAFAARLAAEGRLRTMLAPPYDARAIFGAARAGDELAQAVVAEEVQRIAAHILPIAA